MRSDRDRCTTGGFDASDAKAFDRITRLVARALSVPASAIALLQGGRLVVVARHGCELARFPGQGELPVTTLEGGEAGALLDLGALDPPLSASGDDGRPLRFLAGAPIRGPGGTVLGVLLAGDVAPRKLDADSAGLLADLATLVADQLRRASELSDHRHALAALAESERRFKDFAEIASDWFWETDAELRYTWLSDSIREKMGIEPAWHYGKTRLELVARDADLEVVRAIHEKMLRHEPYRDLEYVRRGPEADHWLRVSGKPVFDAQGRFQGYRGIGRNITEAKQQEQLAKEIEERYRRLVEMSPDGIVVHREGRIVYANAKAVAILGGRSLEDVVGLSSEDLCEPEIRPLIVARIRRLMDPGTVLEPFEFRLRRLDGRWIDVESRGVAVLDRGKPAAQVVIRDVTERRALEAELRRLAHHDPLTGLPNRTLFFDRIAQLIRMAVREQQAGALLLLDLDGFKLVNDTFGHDCGDAVLCATARRLEACVRASDTAARLAGDEFALLLYPVDGAAGARAAAERIVAALAEPVRCGDRLVAVGTSIGVSFFPLDGQDPDLLLKCADLALYRAKSLGRGAVKLFDQELRATTATSRQIAEELDRAIRERTLVLHFQPQIDLRRRACVGMEGVLRWPHPREGLLEAARFVSIAEQHGLGPDLTHLTFELAAAQLAAWRRAHLQVRRLAVNASAAQLAQAGLDGWVLSMLVGNDLDPADLAVEVAEEGLHGRHGAAAKAALARLRQREVRVALDDFGTGSTSLLDLRCQHIDEIKIHETLVRDLPAGRATKPILRAVVDMAHSLGMTVTAEGVERREEVAVLRRVGCDHAQGRLWAPPLPPVEATRWLQAAQSVGVPLRAPARAATAPSPGP